MPQSQANSRPLDVAFLKTTAPTDLGSQLDQALGPAPRRDQLRLCVAAYFFREWGLAPEWGFISQADYARERLSESLSTYCDWAYAGRLFTHSAKCRAAFRSGALTLSALSLLGQRCTSAQAEGWLFTAEKVSVARLRELLRGAVSPPELEAAEAAETAEDDNDDDDETTTVRLSFRLPQSAVSYCEETLELARAMSGAELATADAVGVVLAEASTEVSPADADRHTVPAEFLPPRPSSRRKLPPALDKSALVDESLRPLDSGQRRRRARHLDREMRHAQQRLAAHRAHADDLLLLAFETHWHHDHGYHNFYDFVRIRFGLARTTAIERTHSARLRRLGHPIALARAEGRLGAVKAYLLRRLEKLGVARSALHRWIDHASRTTVRMLRRCLSWARQAARTRQREWALDDFAPPSFAEVRTSEVSLVDLAANPTPPSHKHDPAEPQERLRWSLQAADHALLLDLVAGLCQEVKSQVRQTPDATWVLLHIFHLARHAWSDSVRAMPRHPHKDVLERDHYRCQVPGCSRRAVEAHHIVFRSHGGSDDPTNLICLCPQHHRLGVHDGRLRISGRVTDDRRDLRFDLGVGPSGRALLSYVGGELV